MKKIIFALLVSFGTVCFGQKYAPIVEYNEDGHDVGFFQNWFNNEYETNPIVKQWTTEMLEIVNNNLAAVGETYRVNEHDVFAILKNGSFQIRSFPSNYTNSGIPYKIIKKGKKNIKVKEKRFVFYTEKKEFRDGLVFVFSWGKCKVPLFKKSCLNLLKVSRETPDLQQAQASTPVKNNEQECNRPRRQCRERVIEGSGNGPNIIYSTPAGRRERPERSRDYRNGGNTNWNSQPNTGGPGPAPNTGGPGPAPNTGGPGPAPNVGGPGSAPNTGGPGPASNSRSGGGNPGNAGNSHRR